MRFDTQCVRAGVRPDPSTGAIVPPIYQTATYVLEEVGRNRGYDYSRSSNPTRTALQASLAAIEGARHCAAFASGMSAVDAVLRSIETPAHVVSCDDLYGGVLRLYSRVLARHGYTFTYVDATDPRRVAEAIRPDTRLVWMETPTNPLLKVIDVEAVAEIAHRARVPLAVDATFATPALLRPLALGADIVMHSTTKYLAGHNPVIGGCVLTNDEAFDERMRFMQKAVGAVPGPFDCWLVSMGLKTLALRMARHCENGLAVARFLATHPRIAHVRYPGLETDPGYAVARRQMRGFGGMISFEVRGGLEGGRSLMNRVRLCALAESLGSVETLITHPASMTHADVPVAERRARGLSDGLVRLSVGIEDADDIIADLTEALG